MYFFADLRVGVPSVYKKSYKNKLFLYLKKLYKS